MSRKHHLSPDVEERAQEDLLETLGRIDRLEDERKETSKAFRAVLDEEWSRVRTLRGVLEGRISEQVALPGLEQEPSERNRQIGVILRKAVESIERITGVSPEVQDMAKENGAQRLIRELNPDKLVGTREEAIARHELAWHKEGVNLVATVKGGCYCVEPNYRGDGWATLWTPVGGRSKRLGAEETQAAAKELCAKHLLEHQADAILDNAGDGALAAKELKGEATARKKGRPHA
jgi:hypothetical protein